MATKPHPNIGTIACICCGAAAHVRKGSGGLFIHCKSCGPILNKGQAYQEHILGKATLWGPEGDPAAAPPAAPAPAPAPAPSPTPAAPPAPAQEPRFRTLLG